MEVIAEGCTETYFVATFAPDHPKFTALREQARIVEVEEEEDAVLNRKRRQRNKKLNKEDPNSSLSSLISCSNKMMNLVGQYLKITVTEDGRERSCLLSTILEGNQRSPADSLVYETDRIHTFKIKKEEVHDRMLKFEESLKAIPNSGAIHDQPNAGKILRNSLKLISDKKTITALEFSQIVSNAVSDYLGYDSYKALTNKSDQLQFLFSRYEDLESKSLFGQVTAVQRLSEFIAHLVSCFLKKLSEMETYELGKTFCNIEKDEENLALFEISEIFDRLMFMVAKGILFLVSRSPGCLCSSFAKVVRCCYTLFDVRKILERVSKSDHLVELCFVMSKYLELSDRGGSYEDSNDVVIREGKDGSPREETGLFDNERLAYEVLEFVDRLSRNILDEDNKRSMHVFHSKIKILNVSSENITFGSDDKDEDLSDYNHIAFCQLMIKKCLEYLRLYQNEGKSPTIITKDGGYEISNSSKMFQKKIADFLKDEALRIENTKHILEVKEENSCEEQLEDLCQENTTHSFYLRCLDFQKQFEKLVFDIEIEAFFENDAKRRSEIQANKKINLENKSQISTNYFLEKEPEIIKLLTNFVEAAPEPTSENGDGTNIYFNKEESSAIRNAVDSIINVFAHLVARWSLQMYSSNTSNDLPTILGSSRQFIILVLSLLHRLSNQMVFWSVQNVSILKDVRPRLLGHDTSTQVFVSSVGVELPTSDESRRLIPNTDFESQEEDESIKWNKTLFRIPPTQSLSSNGVPWLTHESGKDRLDLLDSQELPTDVEELKSTPMHPLMLQPSLAKDRLLLVLSTFCSQLISSITDATFRKKLHAGKGRTYQALRNLRLVGSSIRLLCGSILSSLFSILQSSIDPAVHDLARKGTFQSQDGQHYGYCCPATSVVYTLEGETPEDSILIHEDEKEGDNELSTDSTKGLFYHKYIETLANLCRCMLELDLSVMEIISSITFKNKDETRNHISSVSDLWQSFFSSCGNIQSLDPTVIWNSATMALPQIFRRDFGNMQENEESTDSPSSYNKDKVTSLLLPINRSSSNLWLHSLNLSLRCFHTPVLRSWKLELIQFLERYPLGNQSTLPTPIQSETILKMMCRNASDNPLAIGKEPSLHSLSILTWEAEGTVLTMLAACILGLYGVSALHKIPPPFDKCPDNTTSDNLPLTIPSALLVVHLHKRFMKNPSERLYYFLTSKLGDFTAPERKNSFSFEAPLGTDPFVCFCKNILAIIPVEAKETDKNGDSGTEDLKTELQVQEVLLVKNDSTKVGLPDPTWHDFAKESLTKISTLINENLSFPPSLTNRPFRDLLKSYVHSKNGLWLPTSLSPLPYKTLISQGFLLDRRSPYKGRAFSKRRDALGALTLIDKAMVFDPYYVLSFSALSLTQRQIMLNIFEAVTHVDLPLTSPIPDVPSEEIQKRIHIRNEVVEFSKFLSELEKELWYPCFTRDLEFESKLLYPESPEWEDILLYFISSRFDRIVAAFLQLKDLSYCAIPNSLLWPGGPRFGLFFNWIHLPQIDFKILQSLVLEIETVLRECSFAVNVVSKSTDKADNSEIDIISAGQIMRLRRPILSMAEKFSIPLQDIPFFRAKKNLAELSVSIRECPCSRNSVQGCGYKSRYCLDSIEVKNLWTEIFLDLIDAAVLSFLTSSGALSSFQSKSSAPVFESSRISFRCYMTVLKESRTRAQAQHHYLICEAYHLLHKTRLEFYMLHYKCPAESWRAVACIPWKLQGLQSATTTQGAGEEALDSKSSSTMDFSSLGEELAHKMHLHLAGEAQLPATDCSSEDTLDDILTALRDTGGKTKPLKVAATKVRTAILTSNLKEAIHAFQSSFFSKLQGLRTGPYDLTDTSLAIVTNSRISNSPLTSIQRKNFKKVEGLRIKGMAYLLLLLETALTETIENNSSHVNSIISNPNFLKEVQQPKDPSGTCTEETWKFLGLPGSASLGAVAEVLELTLDVLNNMAKGAKRDSHFSPSQPIASKNVHAIASQIFSAATSVMVKLSELDGPILKGLWKSIEDFKENPEEDGPLRISETGVCVPKTATTDPSPMIDSKTLSIMAYFIHGKFHPFSFPPESIGALEKAFKTCCANHIYLQPSEAKKETYSEYIYKKYSPFPTVPNIDLLLQSSILLHPPTKSGTSFAYPLSTLPSEEQQLASLCIKTIGLTYGTTQSTFGVPGEDSFRKRGRPANPVTRKVKRSAPNVSSNLISNQVKSAENVVPINPPNKLTQPPHMQRRLVISPGTLNVRLSTPALPKANQGSITHSMIPNEMSLMAHHHLMQQQHHRMLEHQRGAQQFQQGAQQFQQGAQQFQQNPFAGYTNYMQQNPYMMGPSFVSTGWPGTWASHHPYAPRGNITTAQGNLPAPSVPKSANSHQQLPLGSTTELKNKILE
eukprot:GHVP01069441.1.p1 GENE.GHVP01069441.1~~GHVP01069441.1.p1  ORF type:complete len:2740 (+),score=487.55 GHVP01069441.1:1063-8220(+)